MMTCVTACPAKVDEEPGHTNLGSMSCVPCTHAMRSSNHHIHRIVAGVRWGSRPTKYQPDTCMCSAQLMVSMWPYMPIDWKQPPLKKTSIDSCRESLAAASRSARATALQGTSLVCTMGVSLELRRPPQLLLPHSARCPTWWPQTRQLHLTNPLAAVSKEFQHP